MQTKVINLTCINLHFLAGCNLYYRFVCKNSYGYVGCLEGKKKDPLFMLFKQSSDKGPKVDGMLTSFHSKLTHFCSFPLDVFFHFHFLFFSLHYISTEWLRTRVNQVVKCLLSLGETTKQQYQHCQMKLKVQTLWRTLQSWKTTL